MKPSSIGIASFAHMHAHSYASSLTSLPQTRMACIWDDNSERGRRAAEHYRTPYEPSLEKFLSREMDGVIICSENAKHKEIARAAARAGKHVMCEKPLATTVADAQAMIDAFSKAGVILATAFPCRFSPAFARLQAAVSDGKIGDVVGIAGTNHGKMPGGWFIELEKSGGGAVIDHTVHVVDLMRHLLKAEVKRVYAEIDSLMYHSDFDDVGLLSLDFEDGVFATLDTSWSRPKSYPFWGDVTMEVAGTKGLASLDMFSQKFVTYSDKTMTGSYNAWGSSIDQGLVASFVDACSGRSAPNLASGEDGLRALEVALAAYESAKHAQPVILR